jgi:AcrR family transcriptional regulator
MAPLPAGATVPLRSDAERNRRALVRAARAVFGERGLDAPLDEIARRAEVGNATLYRRFPTRCALLAAVFADTLEDVVAATERAIADPDPWSAFANHVTFLCELQATDRGLADLLTTTIRGVPALERLRKRAHDGFVRIADRAIDNGTLRADFRPEDIVLLLMANAGLVHRTAADAPAAWRRLLSYTLDGLAMPSAEPAAPSPGHEAVQKAMTTLAKSFGCHKPGRR